MRPCLFQVYITKLSSLSLKRGATLILILPVNSLSVHGIQATKFVKILKACTLSNDMNTIN